MSEIENKKKTEDENKKKKGLKVVLFIILPIIVIAGIVIAIILATRSCAPKGHTHVAGLAVHENEIAAKCETDGSYDEVVHCTICHQEMSREHKIVPALGHNYVTTYEWTDLETGTVIKHQTCSHDSSHTLPDETFTSYLTITSDDTSKGNVDVTNGASGMEAGQEITVTAHASDGFEFVAWYSDDTYTTKVSEDNPYTFYMPSPITSIDLYAKFQAIGPDGPDITGDILTIGRYPQSKVDSTLESALDEAKASSTITPDAVTGYYAYQGEYYAEANNYWFKCEPITWKILNLDTAISDGHYYVVSEKILDQTNYAASDPHYDVSTLRSFLTETFFNKAFDDNDKSWLEVMTVDNSALTTNKSTNPYFSDNTNDMVTSLSYKELNETYYSSDTDRIAATTIYSASLGVSDGYWTRSPFDGGSMFKNHADIVDATGKLMAKHVNSTNIGIRPVIQVKTVQ